MLDCKEPGCDLPAFYADKLRQAIARGNPREYAETLEGEEYVRISIWLNRHFEGPEFSCPPALDLFRKSLVAGIKRNELWR
jgi:hypothetical protein